MKRAASFHWFMILCHALLSALALVVVAFAPRPGDSTVLLPIHSGSVAAAFAWADEHNARVEQVTSAPGDIPLLIVVLPHHSSLLSALADGFIPMAAVPALCGSVAQQGLIERV